MANVTHGTAHVFGVQGTVASATVMAFNKTKGFALSAETKNESGITIERRYDDRTVDATITLRIQSGYAIPAQGATLIYDSVTYEIVSVSESESNESHKTVDMTLKQSEGITYA